MISEKFDAGDWIERLAAALPDLAKVQDPYLQEHWQRNPRKHVVVDGQDVTPFPLDDLGTLYGMADYSRRQGGEAHFASLLAALDPVTDILRTHPTLAPVVGRVLGDDDFWVQILGNGSLTSLTDLVRGLMARAHELSESGFRAAAADLHAFLAPAGEGTASGVPGDLDIGYDALLFHGLCLEEEIDIGGGLKMMPFEQARAFVNEEVLTDVVPDTVRFRDWRLVGALVKPFRWKPAFRKRGDDGGFVEDRPVPFSRDAVEFLELLAVSHRVPIVCLIALRECLSRSACRLLGQAHHHGELQWGRPVHRFDPFAEPPIPRAEALAQAKKVYGSRKSTLYQQLAPVVSRLAEALSRDGRFAAEDRILDAAIALERMYALDGGELTHKMSTRAAWFLGEDAEGRFRERKSVVDFYSVRSGIVHNRKRKASAERYLEAFDGGFDIAARTLFKLLEEGSPENWEELVIAGK